MKIQIKSLNLKEELNEVYIYQDCNTRRFHPYYNDEIKLPINLEKMYWKLFGKTKDYFSEVEDIKIEILKNVNDKPTGDLHITFIRE